MTTPRYHPALAELVKYALHHSIEDNAVSRLIGEHADTIQSLITQPKKERRVVQIAGVEGEGLLAVASDGTAWILNGKTWLQLPPIPQDGGGQ